MKKKVSEMLIIDFIIYLYVVCMLNDKFDFFIREFRFFYKLCLREMFDYFMFFGFKFLCECDD